MSDTPEPNDAFMDSLLSPQPAGDGPEPLRRLLLARTTGLLRRRRQLRWLALAGAMAACFAAGMLTMRLLTAAPPVPAAHEEVVKRPSEPSPAPPPAVPESALALEWQSVDSPQPRRDLDRRAGDRYLAEDGDVQAALRCYERALAGATDEELAISSNDNWLLMAIKDARQKEKRHATNGN
jgi:hypothetical protein